MIQLSTQPLPGVIPGMRAAGSPLGTTSDFALALADLAGAPGLVPLPVAPAGGIAVMDVGVRQAIAGGGNPLPVAGLVAIAGEPPITSATNDGDAIVAPEAMTGDVSSETPPSVVEEAPPAVATPVLDAPVPRKIAAARASRVALAAVAVAQPLARADAIPTDPVAPPSERAADALADSALPPPVATSVITADLPSTVIAPLAPVATPEVLGAPSPPVVPAVSSAVADQPTLRPVIASAPPPRAAAAVEPQSIGALPAPVMRPGAATSVLGQRRAAGVSLPVRTIPADVATPMASPASVPAVQLASVAPPAISDNAAPAAVALPPAATAIVADPVATTTDTDRSTTRPPALSPADARPARAIDMAARTAMPANDGTRVASGAISPSPADSPLPPRTAAIVARAFAEPVAAASSPPPIVASDTPRPPAAIATPAEPNRATNVAAAPPSVTITVVAPPATPPTPQPAAQAFAAAMFAAAEPTAERADTPADDLLFGLITSPAPTTLHAPTLAVVGVAPGQQPALDMARDDWMASMIDRIETLRDESGGVRETRMKLVPEALGNLEVSVRRDEAGVMQVRIAADTPQARAVLADAAPKLAEMAEARGLKLGGSSVDSHAGSADQGRREAPTPVQRLPASVAANDTADTTTDSRLA